MGGWGLQRGKAGKGGDACRAFGGEGERQIVRLVFLRMRKASRTGGPLERRWGWEGHSQNNVSVWLETDTLRCAGLQNLATHRGNGVLVYTRERPDGW